MGLVVFVLIFLCLRMAWRGWRGAHTGSEWRCGRCDFDLTGRREGDARCPECGEKLARVGGMVRGHRVRSRRKVAIGLTAAVLLGSPMIATVAGRKVNWLALEPGWMLRWEFRHAAVGRQHAAGVELLARALRRSSPKELASVASMLIRRSEGDDEGALVAEQLATALYATGPPTTVRGVLLKWALDRHEDLSRPFSVQLGDLVDRAYWAGELEQARYDRYLDKICSPVLRASPLPAYPGQRIPVYIDWRWRGGSGPLAFETDIPGVQFRWGGSEGWFGGPGWGPSPHEDMTTIAPPASTVLEGTATISIGVMYLNRGLAVSYPKLAGALRPVSTVAEHRAVFPLHAELSVAAVVSEKDRLRAELGCCFQAVGGELSENSASVPVFMSLPPGADRIQFAIDWRDGGSTKEVGRGTLSAEGDNLALVTPNLTLRNIHREGRGWTQDNIRVPSRSTRAVKGTLRIHVLQAWNGDTQVLTPADSVTVEVPVNLER
jgi:hypothetical protein